MRSSNQKIPVELKKHVRKTVLKRVVPCAILLTVFAVILVLFGNTICNTDNKAFQVCFYVVVMLVPFAVTGVPFKLIDKTYEGVVEEVSVETTVDNESSVKPTREHLYRKNTIYLTVKLSDGKRCSKKVYEGRANSKGNWDMYKKGDRVFHLYGSKYTVILPKERDGEVQCAVCGDSNKIENDICRSCGNVLVKDTREV